MFTLPLLVLSAAVTQEHALTPFHAISLHGGIKATVQKGAKASMKLSSSAENLEKIKWSVNNGTLEIEPKSHSHMSESVKVEIVTPSPIDSVDISGGVTLTGVGLRGEKCTIEASGGTDIVLDSLACDALKIEASGGAELTLKGTTKSLDLDASGGVTLELNGLAALDADIDASGGVTGKIAVSNNLKADLSGGVDLKIKGQPKVAKLETSGGANLRYEAP